MVENFEAVIYDQKAMAIFIDGDNISGTRIEDIIKESSKYGQVVMIKVYKNWQANMNNWHERINTYSITPCHIHPSIAGKNSTDIALAVDLMDVLHDGIYDGFCIVSNDSDYAVLARRVKEHKKFVLGMGMKHTPKALQNACSRFVFLENIESQTNLAYEPSKDSNDDASSPPVDGFTDESLLEKLLYGFGCAERDDGTALLTMIIQKLKNYDGSFDHRNYNASKALDLIERFPDDFEILKPESGPGPVNIKRKINKTDLLLY